MYDAIVVGARCAGSPLAMLLARKGYRILLVDRATFPSDLALSTHYIHQAGIARLKEWGVLGAVVATNCPPTSHFHFDFGAFSLSGSPPPADDVVNAYAPRRKILDNILVQAAVTAGAELREGFSVQALLWTNDTAVGIRGHGRGGAEVTEHARIVVGADGMHSLIARAARAPEYNGKPPIQGPYFTYWSGVRMRGF